MREKNSLYILSKGAKYPDDIIDSLKYKSYHQEIIKIKPVSIHVRRLQWNDLIKKKFASKYRLVRPCLSQISRQLLNFELRKKKSFPKNNHVLESKKVANSLFIKYDEYPSISASKITDTSVDTMPQIKMKSCINLAEPPLKKLKQNENEENFFIGFDSGCSPTKSLIKLKTVHLKKFKGLNAHKAKIGHLQSLATKPALFANSDSSLKPLYLPDDGKDGNANCSYRFIKLPDIATKEVASKNNVEPGNMPLFGGFNHVFNKSEVSSDSKTATNSKPIKFIQTHRNGDFSENTPISKTIINCVARKHTSKPNIRFKILTNDKPISKMYIGNTTVNNCNNTSLANGVSTDNDFKNSITKGNSVTSKSILPTIPTSSNDDDSDIETISYISSDEESKFEPFIYLKKTPGQEVNQGYLSANQQFKSRSSNLKGDQFTDSDSDTTLDSLGSVSSNDLCESSEEDLESENRPFVDLGKFLACDFSYSSINENSKGDNITYKSQNLQLKSDCKVKANMLTASDITDTFCRSNAVSGISGFKLKQLLCKFIHSPPQNGYGNFIIDVEEEEEEEEEEETIETPHFLTILDPLIHSIFSTIIRRDMREKCLPQYKLLYIINRVLDTLNPASNRNLVRIKPNLTSIQSKSSSYSISMPSLAPSNRSSIPLSFSSASPVNSNYNRMTLIAPNSVRPNFSHNIVDGGTGNLILIPNSMGNPSGGTLLLQQAPNTSGMTSPRFFISQPTLLTPPPLTLCSNVGRPGIQGPALSATQPPLLQRMKAPTIDLTGNQSLQPQYFQNWPIGLPHNTFIFGPQVISPISCPNHKLEFHQLQSLMKTVVENLKALLRIGFPKNRISIFNAAFQMLYSNNLICCKLHSISAVNKDEALLNIVLDSSLSFSTPFFELPLPSPIQSQDAHSWMIPNYDILIIKRFVFAVDKSTRTIIFPLPPSCIPRDNDSIDKITVVVIISPMRGIGPGLIVFPHSILTRNLLLSLESTNSITASGKSWVLSAHQRGGLTQSMLLEYLDECSLWVNQSSQAGQPVLAVDWWWCLEQKLLSSSFRTLRTVKLHEKYVQHRDPLEISVGVTMERMWGLLVRKFSQSVGPLTEVNFPKFIIQVLKDLCAPQRLSAWCRSSGLFPSDQIKADKFKKSISETLYL